MFCGSVETPPVDRYVWGISICAVLITSHSWSRFSLQERALPASCGRFSTREQGTARDQQFNRGSVVIFSVSCITRAIQRSWTISGQDLLFWGCALALLCCVEFVCALPLLRGCSPCVGACSACNRLMVFRPKRPGFFHSGKCVFILFRRYSLELHFRVPNLSFGCSFKPLRWYYVSQLFPQRNFNLHI